MATDTQSTVVQNGDEIAQAAGYKDAADLVSQTASTMSTGTPAQVMTATQTAVNFTQKLILLTLYQEIQGEYRLDPYKFLNKFESQKIDAGNTKQFIRAIATGNDSFVENAFIPSKLSSPQVDSTIIQLYDSSKNDGSLSQYGFKYLKPLTIEQQEWIPLFTSGQLQEFIDEIVRRVNTSFELFKVQIFQNMINDAKTGVAKKVTGTATNLLTALTQEVYPMLTEMNFLQSDYNININGTATSLNSTAKDDLLIFISNNNYTKLTGALANVFNNELASISRYINENNIVPCSKLITVGDSDTPITNSSDYLMSDSEILVLNKNAIKQLYWVNQQESQSWAQNLTIQITLHVWGAFGFLPWGQGFYYSNPNLNVLPN